MLKVSVLEVSVLEVSVLEVSVLEVSVLEVTECKCVGGGRRREEEDEEEEEGGADTAPKTKTPHDNVGKKAAEAFPAFEKYKVVHSNPPCGCPMGCGTLYGGEGVFWSLFAFPWGSLRSTSPCHALRSNELTSHHRCFLPNLRLLRVAFPSRVHHGSLLPGCSHHALTFYTQKQKLLHR